MCGIVGYLGKKPVVPLVLDSLRQLEYRGYDSSGIAYLDADALLQVYKASGKLLNLEAILPNNPSTAGVAIGHIRWATHGAPTDANAHPHVNGSQTLALVHNGIIENFLELKRELVAKGYIFTSDTDTECVVHLLEEMEKQAPDFPTALRMALGRLRGAYALTIINRRTPERLYAVRCHAPLVVGVGPDNDYVVASDTVAVAAITNRILYLKDNEIVEVGPEGLRLMDMKGQSVPPEITVINAAYLQVDKRGYKHFMLKEIHEQPDVVRNSLAGRLLGVDAPVQMMDVTSLSAVDRIVIIGCGTSYHAGLVGKYILEELVRIPVEVESAGEYRYRNPVLTQNTLILAISQSGETADTLAAIRQARELGTKVAVLTNREDSSMAREADVVLGVRAGVEVSVCATKSFSAQVTVMILLALSLAEARQTTSPERLRNLKTDLFKLPTLMESVLADMESIQPVARKYGSARDMIFIARGVNYPVALEGALKLKEISYIHAEGYSGSELKHGPIAMLDDAIPVVGVLTDGPLFDKMISNCQEAKARDARLIAVSDKEIPDPDLFESVLRVPKTDELLSPLLTTIPLQALAYYMAEHLGKDVDQPRNLAKSVTVE
jgi:glucosamine--fructose-6-phosphate aminotransferase (isomerizing)